MAGANGHFIPEYVWRATHNEGANSIDRLLKNASEAAIQRCMGSEGQIFPDRFAAYNGRKIDIYMPITVQLGIPVEVTV